MKRTFSPKMRLTAIFMTVLMMLACSLPGVAKKEAPTVEKPAVTQPTLNPEVSMPPTAEAPGAPLPPLPTEALTERTALSAEGPWLLIPANEGLWVSNNDGSALTQITKTPVMSPEDLQKGIAPGGYLAFVTADSYEMMENTSLMLLKLPEGTMKRVTYLTPEGAGLPNDPEVCDPTYEAYRALTMGDSLGWSPDGKMLAYIGLSPSGTANLYSYSLETEKITQLSFEETQVFAPSWSPDGKFILYYGATCFGTGAGFAMTGAWAVAADGSEVKKLAAFSVQDTEYEYVAGWYPPASALMVSAFGCQASNIRIKDLYSGAETPIYKGCAGGPAISKDGVVGVLTSNYMEESPGFYLFTLQGQQTAYYSDNSGSDVRYSPDLDLFLTNSFREGNPPYYETLSYTPSGDPGSYQSKELLGFPVTLEHGQYKAGVTADGIRLEGFSAAPGLIPMRGVGQVLLYPGSGEPGMLFFLNETGEFYRAEPPGFTPEVLSRGITIWDGATWMAP